MKDQIQPSASVKLKKIVQLKQKKTCCDFGIDHKTVFPNNFFCSKCKDWEKRVKENQCLHRGMKEFTCEAEHTSFMSLSKKDASWCQMKTCLVSERNNFQENESC